MLHDTSSNKLTMLSIGSVVPIDEVFAIPSEMITKSNGPTNAASDQRQQPPMLSGLGFFSTDSSHTPNPSKKPVAFNNIPLAFDAT